MVLVLRTVGAVAVGPALTAGYASGVAVLIRTPARSPHRRGCPRQIRQADRRAVAPRRSRYTVNAAASRTVTGWRRRSLHPVQGGRHEKTAH
ncbi:MAG: hypothetical protein MZU91_11465 [Desulfosudis oleivorans]|nr:hypothetical protein [Desulfosudis oleivorans]